MVKLKEKKKLWVFVFPLITSEKTKTKNFANNGIVS